MNNKEFELATKDLNEWEEKDILNEITKQFNYCRYSLEPKKNLWTELIKLYLNWFRKGVGDISLGSKLIYTQFHETYSSIDNDKKRVVFKARRPQDEAITIYTNAVAEFDFDEMDFPRINRELNWDICFFGTGILDVSEYDKRQSLLKVKVQSPFTFFIDPKALSIDTARFAGRFIYKTYYDLVNDDNLDKEKVKDWVATGFKGITSKEKLVLEEKAKRYLIGDNYQVEPNMVSGFFEILEWYFYVNGKLWVVWTDNGITKLLGYKKLVYQDEKEGFSKIPFVLFNFQKTSFSALGQGVPEIIEDNHRADVVLKNMFLRGIMLDATSTFLANYKIFLNPKDLQTKEINKVVWTLQPPSGQIVPFPKTQVVSNDTLSFNNLILNEAIGAIGSSRILRGSLTQVKKTATEISIAKAKQDLQISSIMRNIIAGEKDFWYRWLKRHKQFMSENDKKLVALVGYQGARTFTEVKKKDFIPQVDPRVEVISSLEAEPAKIIRRRELAELLPVLGQAGGNVREALRTMLYDMDLIPEQVDVLLPPSPHELRAKLENEMLEKEQIVEIHENDNDLEHIAIHYRAKENEVRNVHIHAHILNYLNKQKLEPPATSKKETKESAFPAKMPEQLPEELKGLLLEQVQPEKEGLFPQLQRSEVS